jgi:hypothetical protein
LIAFLLFIGSLGCIIGIAGSLEIERITLSEASMRIIPALIVLGLDTKLINHIGKDGIYE